MRSDFFWLLDTNVQNECSRKRVQTLVNSSNPKHRISDTHCRQSNKQSGITCTCMARSQPQTLTKQKRVAVAERFQAV